MFFKRFFWEIFLSFSSVIFLGSMAANAFFSLKIQRYLQNDVNQALSDKLEIIEQVLALPGGAAVLSTALKKSRSPANIHLSIINMQGHVLAESISEKQDLDEEKVSISRRVETENGSFILNADLTLSEVKLRIASIRQSLNFTAFCTGLAAMLIAFLLARRITQPVTRITEVSEALRHGDLKARIKDHPNNELGMLSRAINSLADSVEAHIIRRIKMETIRSEFTSNVSHELKTPLTSLRGYIELLQGGAIYDDDNNLRILKIMHKNANHIISLVADLLKLADIESNEDSITFESTDWTGIIDEVCARLSPQLNLKKISLNVEISSTSSIKIHGNRKAMTHILENLIQNAISYTLENGHIKIKTEKTKSGLALRVTDSGIGISSRDIERIFERFYRVDTARSRENGGTGLGLAIVKHIVAQLQGKISVSSTLGVGSTFTVELPIS